MGKNLSKLSLLGVSLVAALSFAACSGDKGSTDNQDNNTFDDSFTLFGYVFDATDGERLGQDVDIYLIQGEEIRRPTRFNTDSSSPLVGEYAFENVPLNLYSTNSEYKVIVVKDGYQRFEGLVANPTANDCYDVSSEDFETCNNTLDTYYNLMRDIPLFELGATAPDVTINVAYDGELVSGATVLLDPCNGGNIATTNDTGDHVMGFYSASLASLSGTTDDNGQVTFAGTDLALGACYDVEVLPVTYETVQLAQTDGAQIIVGLTDGADQEQFVFMDDFEVGNDDDGLYAVSYTALDSDDTYPDGSIQIVFNRPIELLNPDTQFTAVLFNEIDPSMTFLESDPVLGGSVNETLSEDGLTLTLSPNFDDDGDGPFTDKDDLDNTYDSGLAIKYTATIYIADDESAAPLNLADIEFASGVELDAISGNLIDEATFTDDASADTVADDTDDGQLSVQILPACSGCQADDE